MSPRICPGCRALDGEHDFGPGCTLTEEPESEESNGGCQRCGKPLAYPGAIYCGAGCSARAESEPFDAEGEVSAIYRQAFHAGLTGLSDDMLAALLTRAHEAGRREVNEEAAQRIDDLEALLRKGARLLPLTHSHAGLWRLYDEHRDAVSALLDPESEETSDE